MFANDVKKMINNFLNFHFIKVLQTRICFAGLGNTHQFIDRLNLTSESERQSLVCTSTHVAADFDLFKKIKNTCFTLALAAHTP